MQKKKKDKETLKERERESKQKLLSTFQIQSQAKIENTEKLETIF